MNTLPNQTCNIASGKCPPGQPYCGDGECQCSQSIADPSNFTCDDAAGALSAMRLFSTPGKRGPSLTNIYTPISFLPKSKGLAGEKTQSGPLSKLPEEWSWMKNGADKISPVSNQCQCGCCWAVASTSALADRFGIKGTSKYVNGVVVPGGDFPNGIEAPDLSAAWTVMAIGPRHGGPPVQCQCATGGSLAQAGCGFEQIGAKLESCYPFSLYVCQGGANKPSVLDSDQAEVCCSSSESSLSFKIIPGSTKMVVACAKDGSIDQKATHMMLKAEIANYGPVAATFLEYNDFQVDPDSYYRTQVDPAKTWEDVGIYIPKSSYGNETPGGHAVVITGWGTQNGQEFWEVRNSWGVQHGGGAGYFKYAIMEDDPCHLAAPALVTQPGTTTPALAGGAVTFLPGDLPSGFKPKRGNGQRRSPDNYGTFGSTNDSFFKKFFRFTNADGSINWPFVLVLVLVVAIVVALVVQLIPRK